MKLKRALPALAFYALSLLASLATAVTITLIFARAYDPHLTGPAGEGILFFGVFGISFLLVLPMAVIYGRRIWLSRNVH